MKEQENQYRIGSATYEVDRVFTSQKTPQELVVEEIITTAKQAINFDHSKQWMV